MPPPVIPTPCLFASRLIVRSLNCSVGVAYGRGVAQAPNQPDTSVPERGLPAVEPRLRGLAELSRDPAPTGARARRVRAHAESLRERRSAAERARRAPPHLPQLDGGDRRRPRAARAARAP